MNAVFTKYPNFQLIKNYDYSHMFSQMTAIMSHSLILASPSATDPCSLISKNTQCFLHLKITSITNTNKTHRKHEQTRSVKSRSPKEFVWRLRPLRSPGWGSLPSSNPHSNLIAQIDPQIALRWDQG